MLLETENTLINNWLKHWSIELNERLIYYKTKCSFKRLG